MLSSIDSSKDLDNKVCQEYLKLFGFRLTPVSSYWRSLKSIRSILLFLFIMWILYLCGMSAYVHQMLTVYHGNNTQSLPESVKDMQKIIKSMVEDEHNCHYCLQNHTNDETINKMIQVYDDYVQQQSELLKLRFVLSLFAIFNILVVFILYGGPVTINILTTINSAIVLTSLYVDKLNTVVFMESTVVCVSLVIILQASFALIIATNEISVRVFSKIK